MTEVPMRPTCGSCVFWQEPTQPPADFAPEHRGECRWGPVTDKGWPVAHRLTGWCGCHTPHIKGDPSAPLRGIGQDVL